MTLGRRLLLTNFTLISGVVAIAMTLLWGVFSIQQSVSSLNEEHEEMQALDSASVHLAEAVGMLRAGNHAKPELSTAIREAQEILARLSEAQENEAHQVDLDPYHTEREESLFTEVNVQLLALQSGIQDASANQKTLLADASQCLGLIRQLSAETRAGVDFAEQTMAGTMSRVLTLAAIVTAVAIIGSIVITYFQQRRVMHPLNRLRAAVHLLARRRFKHQLVPSGDNEFRELASDFNRMADDLKELYDTLEQKVKLKSRELVRSERLASVGFLAAGVAHEINNPLGIISTYAELSLRELEKEGDSPLLTDTRESLRIVHEEAHRCKEITRRLLELSKRSDGNRVAVSMAAEVAEVAQIVSKLKQYKGIELNVIDDSNMDSRVSANAVEIRQLLLNLLMNAMEAVRTCDGRVTISTSRDNECIVIDFVDTGEGMDEDALNHAFEPFYTRRANGSGHGLGLSICNAIVEDHGGTISAASGGRGKGSRFTVTLPAFTTRDLGTTDTLKATNHG